MLNVTNAAGGSLGGVDITIAVTPEVEGPSLHLVNRFVTFTEQAVNTAPQFLDVDVNFSDPTGSYNGGRVTLSGLLAEDRVSVHNEGAGVGQIRLAGAVVSFGVLGNGTLAGGVGVTMTITLNGNATAAAIDALIQNLTYANASDTPFAHRKLTLNVVNAAGDQLPPVRGEARYTSLTGAASPFNGLDVGSSSSPVPVDLDNDGDLDLVVGMLSGDLIAYRNTGGIFSPLTLADDPFASIPTGFGRDIPAASAPSFVDLDDDGDLDAVVGTDAGFFVSLRNVNGRFSVMSAIDHPFGGAGVGVAARPTFADVAGDGDLDAVTGSLDGRLTLFRRDGAVFTRAFGSDSPFDGLDVGYHSAPAFADMDGDGDLDAVVGNQFQGVVILRNISGTFSTDATGINPFETGFDDRFSVPAFGDLDGDGDLHLVVGELGGTLLSFRNDAGVFTRLQGAAKPFDGLNFGTNAAPGFGDIDGDGDLDLVVGNLVRALRLLENTGTRGAAPSPSQSPPERCAHADRLWPVDHIHRKRRQLETPVA